MASERRLRLLARLADGSGEVGTRTVCAVCADVAGTTGAGIMLLSGDVPLGAVGTTDETSALIEELQFALGEGPCVDAYREDRPVLEPDLAEARQPRWPGFTGAALAAGARAVFGFPLHLGTVRLGALDMYRDQPGPLSPEQHADTVAMADIATRAVLIMQANAPAGQLGRELEDGADRRYIVHQASGMIAVQLEVSVAQALIRLRAYSFGNDRPLRLVAQDVVDRTLRFDRHNGEDDRAE